MSDLRSVGWCPRCRRQPCACGPIPAYMNATPPDSGEREVVGHHCQECKNFAEARDQQYSPPPVSLPLPFAQRILAALEYAIGARGVTRFEALAAELRDRMPK